MTRFKLGIPSPFSIALLLTLLTFALAIIFTQRPENSGSAHFLNVLNYWEMGFWELLSFTMQMALILILGHALALTPIFNRFIAQLTKYCDTTAKAAFMVSLFAILMSFINWGLCLVFGAIFARKVAEAAQKVGRPLNYPLIGAAGYVGMMCWHGGFSGSAPLTVSGKDHFLIDEIGQIPISETILSPMNITTSLALLIILPLLFYFLGRRSKEKLVQLPVGSKSQPLNRQLSGVEKLDDSKYFGALFGLLICFLALRKIFNAPATSGLGFIDLNFINFFLFGLALLFHGSVIKFMGALGEAVQGALGIIIQFPLYAGIMGVMNYSGLGALISQGFIEISNSTTLPLFTLLSGGLVNIFVPSGGGQWAVQGPIVTEAAAYLGVSLPKVIMALSYGDQLTNMLQPFWALPLLGITKLKAKDILPYSSLMLIAGLIIFSMALVCF
jgi:short-chain fatty acids transporter